MKGQIGLVAILGILVVAVVVIYFAWQGLAPAVAPVALTQEQKTVRESIESYVRASAQSVLRNVSLYGGYASPADYPMGSVELAGRPVPYWQYAGQVNPPNLQLTFFQALNDELRANRAALQTSLQEEYGEITLGDVSAAGQILDSQISLTVTLPATFKDQPLPPTYSLAIQTKLGEAYSLATTLVTYLVQKRTLETVTIDSMIQSPLDDGGPTVPFDLAFADCGDYYYKDWWDIKPWAERALDIALGHLYMPGKVPQGIEQEVSHPTWSLPALNGKTYSDLDVGFHLPDDFELELDTLQFTPNPINVIPEPIPMSEVCWSEGIYVRYFLNYPAIVAIKDPLTNNLFRFALQVYVKNNLPGDWIDVSGYLPEDLQTICEAKECPTRITVTDTGGSPIPGASVSFVGCPVGKTDSAGVFDSLVPCGGGALEITAGSQYVKYRESRSTFNDEGINELLDTTVELTRMPLVTLHFYVVNVQNATPWIVGGAEGTGEEIRPATDTEAVYLTFTDAYGDQDGALFTGGIGKLEHLEPDTYFVTGILKSPDLLQDLGSFGQRYTLTEDTTDLYVYMPTTYGFNAMGIEEQQTMAVYLTNTLYNCTIGPISATEYTGPSTRYWSEAAGCVEVA